MATRIFFVLISIAFICVVVNKVKKKRFFEQESFLWVLGSIAMLLLAIIPNSIKVLSHLVGIEYAPSLLFLVAIIFLLYLLFRQSEQVSLLKAQVKELGQNLVVLQKITEENNQKNNSSLNREKEDEV